MVDLGDRTESPLCRQPNQLQGETACDRGGLRSGAALNGALLVVAPIVAGGGRRARVFVLVNSRIEQVSLDFPLVV